MILGKPTGIVLFTIFLGIAFCMDFTYGTLIVLGIIPVPSAYLTIGIYCGIFLLFGEMIGLTLSYGL